MNEEENEPTTFTFTGQLAKDYKITANGIEEVDEEDEEKDGGHLTEEEETSMYLNAFSKVAGLLSQVNELHESMFEVREELEKIRRAPYFSHRKRLAVINTLYKIQPYILSNVNDLLRDSIADLARSRKDD